MWCLYQRDAKKELYGKIREFLKATFHELARQKGCEIVGGAIVQDHVHMLISIPPKYAVSEIVGYLKGKSAIAVARQFGGRKRNLMVRTFGPEAILFQLSDSSLIRLKAM